MRYASLRQGLVGCWCPSVSGPFGYRLPDLSGYGNHGTLINFALSGTTSNWVPRSNKIALDFDGSDDYGIISYKATPAIGFSAWVRLSSTSGATIAKNWGSVTGAFHFDASTNGLGRLALYVSNQSGLTFNITDPNTMTTNVWYHVAFNIINNIFDIWKNGVRVANSTYTGTLRQDRPNIGIGMKLNNEGTGMASPSERSPLDGSLDDIRIYNRALSESEIRLLASGRGIGLIPERQRNRYSAPAPTSRNRSSRFLSFPA